MSNATPVLLARRPANASAHRWLFDGLRDAILEHRLPPGARLPSSRDLAAQLDVARGTLVAVFEQLRAEGYLEARTGAGTFVARELPDAWFRVKAPRLRERPSPRSPTLSRFGRSLGPSPFPTEAEKLVRPFRPHLAAADGFPHELWSRLVGRHARQTSRASLHGGDAAGLPALRRAIAAHVQASRGVSCSSDQVIITSSSQQSLDLVSRLLLDPGDEIWLEDPGYVGARAILGAGGATLVPVPVDEHGLRVDLGIARAPEAKVAYVTPAHQAPLGVTLPLERRLALLDWAARAGAWIIEDDYDSEYRYESRPVAALQSLDRHGLVCHLGSFSKTMFSGLRLAYLIAPEALVDRLVAAKSVLDRFTPPLLQGVLAELIEDGHFARHLRRMRGLYAQRRAALLEALAHEAGDTLTVVGAEAGLDIAAWLPEGTDDVAFVQALAARGVTALPLSAYALHPGGRPGLVLGFAGYPPPKLRASAKILGALARSLRGSAPRSPASAPSTNSVAPPPLRARPPRSTRRGSLRP